MSEKFTAKEYAEKLLYTPEYAADKQADVKEKAAAFAEGYKKFMDSAKTEREAAVVSEQMLLAAGYKAFEPKKAYAPGEKVYFIQENKAVVAATIGQKPYEEGFRLVIAHIDCPRLDLRPNPLYESDHMSYFRTHYYGGIRKYQWATIPLAIHGVFTRADGSSVLNVYFSRNSYTLTFRKYTWELFGGNYETVATITAKYNASIFAEFSKPPFNTTYNGRAWECTDSSKYNYALQTLDRMPGFDATFDLYDKSSNKLKTIYYYVQNVGTTVNSSRWPTSTANFSLYKEVQTYFNYATYDEEYHNIDGFNRYSASVAGFYRNQKDFSNNTLYLYYMRKSYTLTFNNYGAVSDNTVEYEAKLDSYNNYVPARPEGFSKNAVFMGWYEVEPSQITSTTQRFDFTGKTMPADNLTLFAYWVEQPVTLTVQVPTLDYTASNDKVAIGTVISGVNVFKDAETKIADAGKTVAQLLGEVEVKAPRTLVLEPGAYPPALVLANFRDKDVDTLLDLMRQAQVTIPLKAVVTPANRNWMFADLLAHLQEEHAAFTAAKESQTV